jgi:hypothetical protein
MVAAPSPPLGEAEPEPAASDTMGAAVLAPAAYPVLMSSSDAPRPAARAPAPAVRSVVLIDLPKAPTVAATGSRLAALADYSRPLAESVTEAAEAPPTRKARVRGKPGFSLLSPTSPTPSSPQAPTPFLAGASGGSSSGFSVATLAALLALLVVAHPRAARVLRPVGLLIRPPAFALALKRPG